MENPYKRLSKINPQRENGNRQIANDVYRAMIKAKLSGAEYQLVLFIIDKSWGFNKTSDGIPFSQMQKASNLSRPGAINTIKKLEKRRILIINRITEKGRLPVNEYLFNKHYDTWIDKTGKAQFTSLEVEEFAKLVKHSLPDGKQTGKQMEQKEGQTGKLLKQKEPKLVKQGLPSKEIVSKEILISKGKGINFIKTWKDFKAMRKKIRKEMTEKAEELLLNRLNKLTNSELIQIAILNQSIINSWTNIYPLKEKQLEDNMPNLK
ncbi:hypothetical protein ES708_18427 [subsurface metagenome]